MTASEYTKMTSAQRIASPRSLPRVTVQEADPSRCQCHTFSLWRAGGAWRFSWQHSDGNEMTMQGVYREVSPPERFVSTESWGPEWPETVNTATFSEEAGRTTVVVTSSYPSKEARDAALETGMKQGMNMSFDRLAAYLA